MKKVDLQFNNSADIIDFILTEQLAGIEVKSCSLILSGNLSDENIVQALTRYQATLIPKADIIDLSGDEDLEEESYYILPQMKKLSKGMF